MLKKINWEKTIITENGCMDNTITLDKNKIKIFLIKITWLIVFRIQKKISMFKSWKNRAKQIILASLEIQIKKTLKLKIYKTKLDEDFFKKNFDKKKVINKHNIPNVIWNIFDAATEYSNIWKYKFNI